MAEFITLGPAIHIELKESLVSTMNGVKELSTKALNTAFKAQMLKYSHVANDDVNEDLRRKLVMAAAWIEWCGHYSTAENEKEKATASLNKWLAQAGTPGETKEAPATKEKPVVGPSETKETPAKKTPAKKSPEKNTAPKKKVLSLMTGPPNEPPVYLRLNGASGDEKNGRDDSVLLV